MTASVVTLHTKKTNDDATHPRRTTAGHRQHRPPFPEVCHSGHHRTPVQLSQDEYLGRRIIENFTLLYERWHIQMWRQNALDHYLRLMEEYPEVVQNIPLKYVASYLGITVQSLSRIRASIGSAEETPPFRR